MSAVTSSLTGTEVKKAAQADALHLLRKANDELVHVYTAERTREAKITYTLAHMEMQNPKTWDAGKVKVLLDKMIKQLNLPQPVQAPKPTPRPASPTVPVGQPIQSPQPAPTSPDFFNIKKPSPSN